MDCANVSVSRPQGVSVSEGWLALRAVLTAQHSTGAACPRAYHILYRPHAIILLAWARPAGEGPTEPSFVDRLAACWNVEGTQRSRDCLSGAGLRAQSQGLRLADRYLIAVRGQHAHVHDRDLGRGRRNEGGTATLPRGPEPAGTAAGRACPAWPNGRPGQGQPGPGPASRIRLPARGRGTPALVAELELCWRLQE